MRIEKSRRSKNLAYWLIVQDWLVDRQWRAFVSSLLIPLLLCLSFGCDQPSANPNKNSLVQDVPIVNVGPLNVVARQCKPGAVIGTVSTDGIAIIANENSQIGSISGAIFYDHDRNGEFDMPIDGLILKVDKSIEALSSEAVFNPGVVHSGPGIGPLRMDCTVDTVVRGDEKETVHIKADLSPIFNTQDK